MQDFWQPAAAFSAQHLAFGQPVLGQPVFSPADSAATFVMPGCSLACLCVLLLSVVAQPARATTMPTDMIKLNSFFTSVSPRKTHHLLGRPTPSILLVPILAIRSPCDQQTSLEFGPSGSSQAVSGPQEGFYPVGIGRVMPLAALFDV